MTGILSVRSRAGSWIAMLSLVALFAAPHAVEARKLAGAVHVADGMVLQMELKEGMLSEGLRWIHVKSAPREHVDLTAAGQNGDRIWVGTDYYLYCQKKGDAGYTDDQTYKIGRAHKLWDIRLMDGVDVAEAESVMNTFTGNGGAKALAVTVGKAEKKASDVERAGMKFWCDELVYQYDSPGAKSKDKPDNFKVISACLLAALPSRIDDGQDRFNNFKVLSTFIKESKDAELVPFRALLEKKLEALQAEKDKAKDDADKFDSMAKEYEKLKADVMKRTEGF